MQMLWRKRVKGGVISRVNGDELTLNMSRKLSDLDAPFTALTFKLVAIGFAFRRLFEVDTNGIV